LYVYARLHRRLHPQAGANNQIIVVRRDEEPGFFRRLHADGVIQRV
jgi:hypothetical protein